MRLGPPLAGQLEGVQPYPRDSDEVIVPPQAPAARELAVESKNKEHSGQDAHGPQGSNDLDPSGILREGNVNNHLAPSN